LPASRRGSAPRAACGCRDPFPDWKGQTFGANTPSPIPLPACASPSMDAGFRRRRRGRAAGHATWSVVPPPRQHLAHQHGSGRVFHSSMRRCGSLSARKSSNACRASPYIPAPGSRSRATRSSPTRVRFPFLPKQFYQIRLTAALRTGVAVLLPAPRHFLRHRFSRPAFDITCRSPHDVFTALIMRNHHHPRSDCAERIDAVASTPRRVIIDAGNTFIRMPSWARTAPFGQISLRFFRLAAGEPSIDAAASMSLRVFQSSRAALTFLE